VSENPILSSQQTLFKRPLIQSLEIIKNLYPTVQDFERNFPSLCFALATGVGKTRLMGAFISYLYITGTSRHFFVLAPNLTIYNKLIQDFHFNTPKYVFKGITEFNLNPPIIITGENYEDGRGVRIEISGQGRLFENEKTVHINIFNISKIPGGVFCMYSFNKLNSFVANISWIFFPMASPMPLVANNWLGLISLTGSVSLSKV
jgi:hypothetical protein